MYYLIGGWWEQFSKEPLEIKKKQTTRCGTLEKLIILANLLQLTVPIPIEVLQYFYRLGIFSPHTFIVPEGQFHHLYISTWIVFSSLQEIL